MWLPAGKLALWAILLCAAFAEPYWASVINLINLSRKFWKLTFRDRSKRPGPYLKWPWVRHVSWIRPICVSQIESCVQFQHRLWLTLSSGEWSLPYDHWLCVSTRHRPSFLAELRRKAGTLWNIQVHSCCTQTTYSWSLMWGRVPLW